MINAKIKHDKMDKPTITKKNNKSRENAFNQVLKGKTV